MKWIADSGHEWLEVNTSELVRLDIVDKISQWSYLSKNGLKVYLEGDCDATVYLNASGYNGNYVPEVYQDGRSKIRNYPTYQPDWINDNKNYFLSEIGG
jgi:hypothetical protein